MDTSSIFATNRGKYVSPESLNLHVNEFLILHQSTNIYT